MDKRSRAQMESNGDSHEPALKRARTGRRTSTASGSRSRSISRASTSSSRRSSVTPRGRNNTVNQFHQLSSVPLNVYVFGSGNICELGLGPTVLEVKRPRLNPLLPRDSARIVDLAVGGAHVIAIDLYGKLWTWGPNDTGVLGRNSIEPPLADDESEDEDKMLNALESTPAKVEAVPDHVSFVTAAATDSCSMAVTNTGHVWAWGSFNDEGEKAFKPGVPVQRTPAPLLGVDNIVQVAGGKEHFLMLDRSGHVHSWGIGENYQLGYAVNTRLRTKTFRPSKVTTLTNIKYVACGEYHSLAVDHHGHVWGWGLNNFCQTGLPNAQAGGANVIEKPTLVPFFMDKKVVQVDGGDHHSIFLTEDGSVYTVGENNFYQLGVPKDNYPPETQYTQSGRAGYIPIPQKLEVGNYEDESVALPKMKFVTCGTQHCLALSQEDGSIWSWGYGELYQLGHGKPAGEDEAEDEEVPRRIKNTATTGVNMVLAGAGGRFSVTAGVPSAEGGN